MGMDRESVMAERRESVHTKVYSNEEKEGGYGDTKVG